MILTLHKYSFQSEYEIYNAFWMSDGRRFRPAGKYELGKLHMVDSLFPNERYGFNGRKFRITTNFVSVFLISFLPNQSEAW